jgi:hypothetical protein
MAVPLLVATVSIPHFPLSHCDSWLFVVFAIVSPYTGLHLAVFEDRSLVEASTVGVSSPVHLDHVPNAISIR